MNTHHISTTEALRLLGFDVKIWPGGEIDGFSKDTLQITDSTGITFYMDETSTLEQCLARYEIKKQQFNAVNTK